MTVKRFVPQDGATRNVSSRHVALTYHFSRSIPPALHLSFCLRQFRIQRGRVAAIVCVSLRTRGTNDTHANAGQTDCRERYVVQAHTYQIKKEKVNSLPVEDWKIFVRKLVYLNMS